MQQGTSQAPVPTEELITNFIQSFSKKNILEILDALVQLYISETLEFTSDFDLEQDLQELPRFFNMKALEVKSEFKKNKYFQELCNASTKKSSKEQIKKIILAHIESRITENQDFSDSLLWIVGEFGIISKYRELFLSAIGKNQFELAIMLAKILGGIPDLTNLKKIMGENKNFAQYKIFLNYIIDNNDFQMAKLFIHMCDGLSLIKLIKKAFKKKKFEVVRLILETESCNYIWKSIWKNIDTYNYALFHAVQSNEFETARSLIVVGGTTTRCNYQEDGNNALHWAIINVNQKMAKLLVTNNFNLTEKNLTGETPIVLAAKLGQFEIVKCIATAKKTDANDYAGYGFALLYAIEAGEIEAVKILIIAGARRDFPESDQSLNFALHLAVKKNNLPLVKLLVDNGFGLMPTNSDRVTPIVLAAKLGQFEMVKCIAQAKKADVNDNACYGLALLYAIKAGELEVVESLIKAGAQRSFSKKSNYALHQAVIKNNHQMVKLLIAHDFDLTQKNEAGKISIRLAAELGYFEIVKFIAETQNADINNQNEYGFALLDAVNANDIEAVKLLIKANATISCKTGRNQNNALHLAQSPRMVELLLANGFDFTEKNAAGLTPIDLAAEEGDNVKMELIQNHRNSGEIRRLYQSPKTELSVKGETIKDNILREIAPQDLMTFAVTEEEKATLISCVWGADESHALQYFYGLMLMAENYPINILPLSFKEKWYDNLFKQVKISLDDIALYDFIINKCKNNFDLRYKLIDSINTILQCDKSINYNDKKGIFLMTLCSDNCLNLSELDINVSDEKILKTLFLELDKFDIHTVNLSHHGFWIADLEKCTAIFSALSSSPICGINLRNNSLWRLNPEQWKNFCYAIAISKTKYSHIDISGNDLEIAQVEELKRIILEIRIAEFISYVSEIEKIPEHLYFDGFKLMSKCSPSALPLPFKQKWYGALFNQKEISVEDIALYDFIVDLSKNNSGLQAKIEKHTNMLLQLNSADKFDAYQYKKEIFLSALCSTTSLDLEGLNIWAQGDKILNPLFLELESLKINHINLRNNSLGKLNPEEWTKFCHSLAVSKIPFAQIDLSNNDVSNAQLNELEKIISKASNIEVINEPIVEPPVVTKNLVPYTDSFLASRRLSFWDQISELEYASEDEEKIAHPQKVCNKARPTDWI